MYLIFSSHAGWVCRRYNDHHLLFYWAWSCCLKEYLAALPTGGFSTVGAKWTEAFAFGSIPNPQRNAGIYRANVCISLQAFAVCLELQSLELCFPQELNKDDTVFLNSVLTVRCFITKCFKIRLSKPFAASNLEPWAVTWWFQVAGQREDAVNLESTSVFPHNCSYVYKFWCMDYFFICCASSICFKCQVLKQCVWFPSKWKYYTRTIFTVIFKLHSWSEHKLQL